MKLSEALTRLKNLKSQISRVESYIDKSISHYEDEKPEYDYADETGKRDWLLNEITGLKSRIQTTNATTVATFEGEKTTITFLILFNAQLRSELAYWQKMLDRETSSTSYLLRTRTKDDIKTVFAGGFDKKKIREFIENLETRKENVEALLNSANLRTELVGA